MKSEPGAQMAAAAGGWGRLRASHADREQAVDLLKAAFVHGRLAKDEFDARIGQALAARTHADLAAVTADIPAGPAAATADIRAGRPAAPRPRRPARARPSMNNAITGAACVILAAHVSLLAAFISGNVALIILVCVLIVVGATVGIVAMIVAR